VDRAAEEAEPDFELIALDPQRLRKRIEATAMRPIIDAPAVFRVYASCPQCGRATPPEELNGTQPRCLNCQDWHEKAITLLNVAEGCHECKLTWEQIRERAPDADEKVKMYVVPRDGTYQVLCRACCELYVHKVRALYAGTAFAEKMKIGR
jgi:hypothetical protein